MLFSPANTASDPATIPPFAVAPRFLSHIERFFLLLLFAAARLRFGSHTILLLTTLGVLAAWLFYWFGP